MNSEEQQQIQEEAHYWFCLNDVADYVELLGTNQVIKDVAVLLEQRKELGYTIVVKQEEVTL